MGELPACFNAMAEYRQFVIWQATPNKKDPNKTDKITVHPKTLKRHDAHDKSIWFDANTAIATAAILGESYGIGFVFTKDDPFWFFDLDHCAESVNPLVWTQDTINFCNHFAGAAIEISISGEGLHIIGKGSQSIASHSSNNNKIGHQFYTSNRFVALTGTGAMGDSGFDASHLLPDFAAYYFPPKIHASAKEWTTEPDVNSRPLKTDAALIKRMCQTTNAGSVFGDKVSARDLWECNEEKLSVAYPSFNNHSSFDHSSADQALCNHLAFWTGKNCERIDELFRQSSLIRDKWEKRKDYRQETILKSCGSCQNVYGSEKAAKENAVTEWQPTVEEADRSGMKLLGGSRILPYESRTEFFKNHVFLTKTSTVFCPDGVTRGKQDYNAMYTTMEFRPLFGGKSIDKAWNAYIECDEIERAESFDTSYRPEMDFAKIFKEDGRDWVNEYKNRDGARLEGDATPFYNHIKTILPNGRDAEILISWLAALIQYPGVKFDWAPFIQGAQGNGKSLLADVIRYCIGAEHLTDINPDEVCQGGGKFNKFLKTNRLGVLEELKTGARNEAEATLKRWVTLKYIQIQGKGTDQTSCRVCCNLLIYSNHKDGLLIEDLTRRFAPLYCAQQTMDDLTKLDMHEGGKYFRVLFDWFNNKDGWAITANFLDTYVIADALNPATICKRAPTTSSKTEAVNESKSRPHQTLIEILSSGRAGTMKGWVSTQALKMIYKDVYFMKPPSGQMIAKYLIAEGYIRHPALLNNGRTNRHILQEGGEKPILYVKKGSVQSRIENATKATDKYMTSQGYMGAGLSQSPRGVSSEAK